MGFEVVMEFLTEAAKHALKPTIFGELVGVPINR